MTWVDTIVVISSMTTSTGVGRSSVIPIDMAGRTVVFDVEVCPS